MRTDGSVTASPRSRSVLTTARVFRRACTVSIHARSRGEPDDARRTCADRTCTGPRGPRRRGPGRRGAGRRDADGRGAVTDSGIYLYAVTSEAGDACLRLRGALDAP